METQWTRKRYQCKTHQCLQKTRDHEHAVISHFGAFQVVASNTTFTVTNIRQQKWDYCSKVRWRETATAGQLTACHGWDVTVHTRPRPNASAGIILAEVRARPTISAGVASTQVAHWTRTMSPQETNVSRIKLTPWKLYGCRSQDQHFVSNILNIIGTMLRLRLMSFHTHWVNGFW